MVAFLDLHRVAERAGCARDDGDLLHGGGVRLQCGDERVADLVVGDRPLFLVGEDGIFLLITRDDDLDALLKVGLRGKAPAVAHGAQRGLVDDVCKLCARGAGGHARDLAEVHVLGDLDLAGVHLEDLLAALEVGQLHGHAPVKAAGPRERGVERFGAVRGGEDDDAVVALEAVHLGQQLVERLLALIIAAELPVALFADGVDLVDEHDAGGFLLGLPEQVAHLARAHADEHLHEFRAGDGEKRHVCLARNGLGQHRLAGSRRADEQDALGHGRADLLILRRVVQIVDDLGQVLLGLVFTGDVGKLDALGGLDIDLCVRAAEPEHHGVRPAGLVRHALEHELAEGDKKHDRQQPCQQKRQKRRHLLDDLARELRAGVLQAVDQVGIVHRAGFVDLGVVFVREEDLVVLHLHAADLFVLRHGHERAVVDLLDLPLAQPRHGEEVDEQQHEQRHGVVIQHRLFRAFYFIHAYASFIQNICVLRVHFPDSCNVTLVYHNRKRLSSE